jgi:membrane protease YdiL (CAAX protease family)
MFTRKVSRQVKLMMLLIVVPFYFYCGSIITSALIKFLIVQFSLSMDSYTATAYLNIILDSVLVIMASIIFKDSLKQQWRDFLKNKKDNLLYACIIGVAMIYAAAIIGSMISSLFGAQSSSQNQELIESVASSRPLVMFATSVLLAPVFEEILFRGVIFGWAYEVNPIFAHLLSGFLFGFLHIMDAVLSGNFGEFVQIFSYFFMGCVLSFLYEKRNNIFVPIITHSLNNFISMILIFFF